MTARQLTLEEQIQYDGLRDGGHSVAEYHHRVSYVFVCNNENDNIYSKL